MYGKGVVNQTIANIMADVLTKAGKSGEFLASTTRNTNVESQAAMDGIANITLDMTIAEKTIGRLNE